MLSLAGIALSSELLAWAWPAGLAALTIGASIGLRRLATARPSGRRVGVQLAVLGLSGAGLLAVVLTLPIDPETRGQLLGFLGIVASAAIALSSTTLLGNGLAGVMLRLVREFRVGDFVRIEGTFGRVTERGIIHTEIQTEDRDLTTLPNLFLVSHPLTVVRASGTILSTKVSLGYDVSRHEVERCLLGAAETAGLQHPFVQVLELGDFSVSYRVAGLLENVQALLSSRSALNCAVLDSLHGAGIEIASPAFMNTRSVDRQVFVPASDPVADAAAAVAPAGESPESVIFDKADHVTNLAEIEARLQDERKRMAELDKADTEGRAAVERAVADLEREAAEQRERLDQDA